MENEKDENLVIQVAKSLRDYNNLSIKCSCCKNTSYRSHLALARHIVKSLTVEKEAASV